MEGSRFERDASRDTNEMTERSSEPLFSAELRDTRKCVGAPLKDIPDRTSQAQLETMRDDMEKSPYETFEQLCRSNELRERQRELGLVGSVREKAAAGQKPTDRERGDLVFVDQALTYHEYFGRIAGEVMEVMSKYEALRASTPDIPIQLRNGEQYAKLYLQAFNGAVRERVAYANVLRIDDLLRKNPGNADLQRQRTEALASKDLTPLSVSALGGSTEQQFARANALNQRIIEVLGGNVGGGVPDGFFPQQLYLDLLTFKYQQILREQEKIVKDPGNVAAKARFAALKERNDEAIDAQSNGRKPKSPLTESEGREYGTLQSQIADRNKHFEQLSDQRRDITQNLVNISQRLGAHQIHKAELSAIQHHFGDRISLDGVKPPEPVDVPKDTREGLNTVMDLRMKAHFQRLSGFTEVLEGEELHIGLRERVEDVSNKSGREVFRRASNALAKVYTVLVPSTFGLKRKAQESLTEPLNHALGWPVGKEKWEDLTPEEQKQVEEKSKSVLDAIREFDVAKLENFKSTRSMLEDMLASGERPDAFAGQDVADPLPNDRVTPANRDALIQQYGRPTVYLMLFKQLESDWGDDESGTGLMGEYKTFLLKVNKTVDVHLDVGAALFELSKDYLDLSKLILIAILAAVGAVAALKILGMLGRVTMRVIRGKKVRGMQRQIDDLQGRLDALEDPKKGGGERPDQRNVEEELAQLRKEIETLKRQRGQETGGQGDAAKPAEKPRPVETPADVEAATLRADAIEQAHRILVERQALLRQTARTAGPGAMPPVDAAPAAALLREAEKAMDRLMQEELRYVKDGKPLDITRLSEGAQTYYRAAMEAQGVRTKTDVRETEAAPKTDVTPRIKPKK